MLLSMYCSLGRGGGGVYDPHDMTVATNGWATNGWEMNGWIVDTKIVSPFATPHRMIDVRIASKVKGFEPSARNRDARRSLLVVLVPRPWIYAVASVGCRRLRCLAGR